MKEKELVSVVLAVYNGETYLQKQIESITRQTYRNIEIIVVDDGSSDQSVSRAGILALADNRIKVYRNHKNLGIGPNFLKGVSLARGEYICFSDQDDHWKEDKIEILVKLLQSNPENMLAYSDLEICDESLECSFPSFWKASGIRPKRGFLRELSFLKNITPGCSMMFKKEVKDVLAVLAPNAPFLHDHLVLVLSAHLGRIIYTKSALVKYRQHKGNNIGAFYDSAIDKERIINELKKKIEYFKTFSLKRLGIDLHRLSLFCDCLRSGNIFQRVSFLQYYLFLRNDTFLDKALGTFECFFPALYIRLKKSGSKKEVYAQALRLLFLTWSIVVMFFFTNNFILYKFNRFMSWIR